MSEPILPTSNQQLLQWLRTSARIRRDNDGDDSYVAAQLDAAANEIERLEAKWRAERDAYIDAKDEIERLRAALKIATDELVQYIDLQQKSDYLEYAAESQKKLDAINKLVSGDSSAPETPKPSNLIADLRKLHSEIVDSDGHESEMMALVRRGFEEIERLVHDVEQASKAGGIEATENERLRAAMEFYADQASYEGRHAVVFDDKGQLAREALSGDSCVSSDGSGRPNVLTGVVNAPSLTVPGPSDETSEQPMIVEYARELERTRKALAETIEYARQTMPTERYRHARLMCRGIAHTSAVETKAELCPNCGKDEVGTFTADDSFLYGREQYRLIAKDVLFFRCMACGLEYTGEDGENKRMEAVRAHLARQAAENGKGDV